MKEEYKTSELEYKEHQEFFKDYFEAKRQFNMIVNRAYLDLSLVGEAFAKLFEFIGCCVSQIENDITIADINKEKQVIIKLIKDNKKIAALDRMNTYFSKVTMITKQLELEPKPNIVTKNYDLVQHAIEDAINILTRRD